MTMNWFTANVDKRKKRLLEEAENQLLDAEAGLEAATAIANMCRCRVSRLQKDVADILKRETQKHD